MGQIAHFWPPEWLIQSSPPHIEGHHRQLDNQCKDPMNNNKDKRLSSWAINYLTTEHESKENTVKCYLTHLLSEVR